MREKLQLIGSTAILIASKFEVTLCVLSWGADSEGLCLYGPWGGFREGQVTALRAARVACLSCSSFLSQGLQMQLDRLKPVSWCHWKASFSLLCIGPSGYPSLLNAGMKLKPRAGGIWT